MFFSPPILQVVDSDQEDFIQESDEENISHDVENVDSLDNVSESRFTSQKLQELQKFWSSHFDSRSRESIHGLDRNSNSSFIRIKLGDWKDMSHTWLQDLEQSNVTNEDYWSKDKLEIISKHPFFPILDKNLIFPKKLPVKFPSRKEEDYFNSSHFGKSGAKITVPSLIFGVDSMKLPTSDNPLFEYLGRQSTLESQITHQILLLESDIMTTITELVDRLNISDDNVETIVELKDTLPLLQDANALARQSNFRSKSFSITSSCKAKLNMRDSLLSKVKGEEYIKNALRGSCFMDKEIFGPISKDVQSKIDSFSHRSDSKLTPTSFPKRTSDWQVRRGNQNKRAKSNYNSSASGYNPNYNSGYNYVNDYPSTSHSNQFGTQVNQSPSLFQERPRPKGPRGKPRGRGRGRGRGSRN